MESDLPAVGVVAALAVVVVVVGQVRERQRCCLGHLRRTRVVLAVGDTCHERPDREVRHCPDVVQTADEPNPAGIETHLLVTLAQRRLAQALVLGFTPPAGETHLSGVVREVFGALREQQP